MNKLKSAAIVLALTLPIINLAQNSAIKEKRVQQFVKNREDWKPNPKNTEIMLLENGYAIGGYDPVSYFTQNKSQKGDESIKDEWNSATWLFSSKAHRNLFKQNPSKYAPRYGGWSLITISGHGGEGYAAQTNPDNGWIIFEDKLYLLDGDANLAKALGERPKVMSRYIKAADNEWPRIESEIKNGAKVFWPSLSPSVETESHEWRSTLVKSEIMVLHNGYAIGGYDPVAYFELSESKQGNEAISLDWNGASWLFISKKHRDLFKANPEKYAPQYGGWCSYGMSGHGSDGYGAQSRPKDSWSIIDGKLYFNWSPGVKTMFLKDKETYINQANIEWERVRIKLLEGAKVHWKYF